MTLKFWTFKFIFNKDDAKIVLPIILLLMIFYLEVYQALAIALAVIYYLIFFFSQGMFDIIKNLFLEISFKCPKCKNRKIVLQGYQPYKSDQHHAFYLCPKCNTTSIMTENGLTHK